MSEYSNDYLRQFVKVGFVGITASSSDVNNSLVTYSLIGDTSGGGFTINAATGVITVADSTKIDFETSGGSYSKLFDDSVKVLSWDNILWTTRAISTP